MSKKKRKSAGQAMPTASSASEEQKEVSRKVKLHSILVFVTCLLAMLLIFGGRWLWAITEEYYGAFVERYAYSVADAVENMNGLGLSLTEQESLLPLQQEWDLFTSSRLRDEVHVTADDGSLLHGYLYNENSSVTVVVVPRFHQDGTADFLPGVWLNEWTGCNILMPDPRAHGESGGEVFSYGFWEQNDLVCWLNWAETTLGSQTFLLWGEGTGANTILFAAANNLLPEQVAFAVAESPYASLHELAQKQIYAWYTVPEFPFLNAIEWKVNRKSGFKMEDTNLAQALDGKNCDLPVLFLTSSGDRYILPEWSETVYETYSGTKTFISGGLNHGTVYAETMQEIQTVLQTWWSDSVQK